MLVVCPRITLVWKISWKPNTCARSGAQRVGLAGGVQRSRPGACASRASYDMEHSLPTKAEPAKA